jgi:hypothetical protein
VRIGLFPFVLAAGATALALLAVGMFLIFRGKRPLGWFPILLVLVPLAVVDGIVCLYFMVSAGLSHSAAAIRETPVKCLAATAGLVVLPAVVLVTLRLRRPGGPRNPGPPAA